MKWNRNIFPGVPNPFLEWISTPEYRWMLRFIGCLAIFMVVVVEYALLINSRTP
jgi:hypothetical protein